MDSGELLRNARKRHGLTQGRLAFRTGAGQAAISRIERGEVSPSEATLSRLMAAMGEEVELGTRPMERSYDPAHLRSLRERPPAERLQLAISWNRLASRLARAGRRASGA
ncbi:MAG: helix-turn-helix domain-containing protein [Solirubrobacterales bacterium]